MSNEQSTSNEYRDDDEVDVLPGTEARPQTNESFQSVLHRAFSRRRVLQGAAGAGLVITAGTAGQLQAAPVPDRDDDDDDDGGGRRKRRRRDPGQRLGFKTVPAGDGSEPDVRVPPNYEVDVILRWGDPLFPGAPSLDVNKQTGKRQAQQFGFNADLVLFYPLPGWVKASGRAPGLPGLAHRALPRRPLPAPAGPLLEARRDDRQPRVHHRARHVSELRW